MKVVGEKFESGEFFLMHLVSAAEIAQTVIKEDIEPRLKGEKRRAFGNVVLGTVQGDIHDIGKNIVAALLFAGGFEVFDIGKDVPPGEMSVASKQAQTPPAEQKGFEQYCTE